MNDLERKIFGATKEADDAYEESGATGTKCWIRDFFLPKLKEHGLVIMTAEQKHFLEHNAKAMAHAADTHKAEEERLRQEVKILREYGNKDCTAMADERLEQIRSAGHE